MSGRLSIVLVLIVSLVATAVTRHFADWERAQALRVPAAAEIPTEGTSEGASLASMDSFALALLLGGLRGPLVMFLWSSSEDQKTDHDLEDFDTKIEWIRLLQPEFDSVHVFQIWNKGWNISAQLSSLSSRYQAILDALRYAKDVLHQRPNDINILYAIGQVYGDKLGGSEEKTYYRHRVREETKWRPPDRHAGEIGWRPSRLDPMLDPNGNLLPNLIKPVQSRPASLPPDAQWVDGSELQFLARYQPFPDGLSALALSYNYYKRTQVIASLTSQRHIQIGPRIVDSRPAVALRQWSEDEWERARRFEIESLGAKMPTDVTDSYALEMPTANVPPTASSVHELDAARKAVNGYRLASQLCTDAAAEYHRHLLQYGSFLGFYAADLDRLGALGRMFQGDHDYLQAMLSTDPQQRRALLGSAQVAYDQANLDFYRILLRYYTYPRVLAKYLPSGMTADELLKNQPKSVVEPVATQLRTLLTSGTSPEMQEYINQWYEYGQYIQRCIVRMQHIRESIAAASPLRRQTSGVRGAIGQAIAPPKRPAGAPGKSS